MVCDRAVATMERRVETRDLQQLRTGCQQGADRREIVRLMQRRQRNISLEIGDHRTIDHDRPVVLRSAMYDPMADRDQVEVLHLAKPARYHGNRGRHVRDHVRGVGLVDQR